jgi:hypothetical protein
MYEPPRFRTRAKAGMPPMKMRALAKSRAFAGSVVEMFEPPPPLMTQKQLDEVPLPESSPDRPLAVLAGRVAKLSSPGPPHAQARAPFGSAAAPRGDSPQRASSSPTSAVYKQFACPKCGKSYQKEASLKFHLRYALAHRCARIQQQACISA